MDTLFALKRRLAEDVRGAIDRPSGYSAVRAMLAGWKLRAVFGIAKRDCAMCPPTSHAPPPGAVRFEKRVQVLFGDP